MEYLKSKTAIGGAIGAATFACLITSRDYCVNHSGKLLPPWNLIKFIGNNFRKEEEISLTHGVYTTLFAATVGLVAGAGAEYCHNRYYKNRKNQTLFKIN